jgi:hypothetical protein
MMMMMLCFIESFCNNGFGTFVPAYGQQENINGSSLSPSFQSRVAMINQIPSQKVTVGDINIAYKQLGKSNAKPIILITGLGATMDMSSPLLIALKNLTSGSVSKLLFSVSVFMIDSLHISKQLLKIKPRSRIKQGRYQFRYIGTRIVSIV